MLYIRLKRQKCVFMVPEVENLGYLLNHMGLHPSPAKVNAIAKAPVPKNKSQLKAILGSVNYYGKFLPNWATTLALLYCLIKERARWVWGKLAEAAFSAVKAVLSSESLLVHFDLAKPLILACDASFVGVGAVLSHCMKDGLDQPIAFTSQTLTPAERNYSQL